jgi:hypothetical protein
MATSTETKIIEIKVPLEKAIEEIASLTAAIDELNAETKKLDKTDAATAVQIEKNRLIVKDYQNQKRQLTNEVMKEVKVSNEALGAYQKLQNEYSKAASKAKNLAIEHGAGSEKAIKAANAAKLMGDRLKEADATVGQHQRNVGNYAESLSFLGGKLGGVINYITTFNETISNTTTNLTTLNQQNNNTSNSFTSFTQNIKQAGSGVLAFGKQILLLLANPVVLLLGAIAALGFGFVALAKNAREFGKAVSELEAITGASGKDLDLLKEKAKEMSSQYGISAVDVVNAMKLVGSAKPELLSNVAALGDMTNAVLTLSRASGMDLEKTTSSLTVIMNQFGHSAKEANEDINILAAGSKYGSVEVDYLAESISKVGTIANAAGLSLETTVAVMELFGEKGVKAETAGRGLKRLLVELQKDTANYTNGVFDLNKSIDNNISISGDNIALQEKFGVEFFGLAQILFQGKERFKELNVQVTGTNVAFEQASVTMNNLSTDTEKAGTAWTNFMLSIEDGSGVFSNVVRFFVKAWTGLLNDLTLLGKDIKSFFTAIGNEMDYFDMRVQAVVNSVGFSFSALGSAIKAAVSGDFSKFKTLFSDISSGVKQFSKEAVNSAFLAAKAIKDVTAAATEPKKNIEEAKTDLNTIETLSGETETEITRKKKEEEDKRLEDLRRYIREQSTIINDQVAEYKKELTPKEATLLDKVTGEAMGVLNASITKNNAIVTNDKETADKQAKIADDVKQKKIQSAFDTANAAADILQGSFAFADALAQNELALWAEQNKGKANFDEEYAKKKAEIDHKQAVRNKVMQVVNSLINGAAAVVSLLATPPLAIAAGIAAALQTAAIIATPIPSPESTGGGGGSAKSPSLPPDMTSKMASPLSSSVNSIQSVGGSNTITSGAANVSLAQNNQPAIYAPKVELSLVELERAQGQVTFIDNISTLKS